jgi:hypothetical protein
MDTEKGHMPMAQLKRTPEEVGRIGEEIYRERIRPQVLSHHKGKFLVLDVNTGEFEVDEDDRVASDRLRARVPGGEFYGLRIGYSSAYTLAGTMVEDQA